MAQINKPNTYFNTVLYTGNGSTQSITGVNFQPDLVWFKNRTSVYNHKVYDVVRGVTKELNTNNNNTENTTTDEITSFDSDGFSVAGGSAVNQNTAGIVAWNWLAGGTASSNTNGSITSSVSNNSTAGFSVVTYTGDGNDNATFGHGLGVTPDLIILKARGNTQNWWVSHKTFSSVSDAIQLNNTNAVANQAFAIKGKSATTITLGIDFAVNQSGINYVSYCWNEVKGFSKFGSYTGNGSAEGTFIYTGFKPAFIILRRTDSAGFDWFLHDNKRNGFNPDNDYLQPNTTSTETNFDNLVDFVSNGWKIRDATTAYNASGGTYIYMAFAENPLVGTNNIPATAR